MKLLAKTKEALVHKFPNITNYLVPPLKHVGIELTNICNLKCKMCYAQRTPKGYMTFQLFKKIIDELPSSVIGVGLCLGGESLLHKEFDNFLNYLHSQRPNIAAGLNTNGVFIDKHLESMRRLDWVCVSLDGFNETNDQQRVGSNYRQIHDNIILLTNHKVGDKPKIRLNMVVTEENKHEILKYYEYWMPKIDEINYSQCFSEKGQYERQPFWKLESRGLSFCHEPFGYMAVTWDGFVTPCCHDSNANNIMGNINKQTINEVWNGKKFRSLRYACAVGSFHDFPHCLNCEIWKFHPLKTYVRGQPLW